jgi:tRNA/rRNA methyltransferase
MCGDPWQENVRARPGSRFFLLRGSVTLPAGEAPGSVEYSLLLSPAECDRLCVVLARTRNPLNLGAAARAISNFGFSRLRVVNPYLLAFREARSAVGAGAVLAGAEEYRNLAAAVADCTLVVGTTAGSRRELQQPLEALPVAARLMRRHLRSARVALIFGSEKTGLSNLELSHCHRVLHIPTCETHPSMNLGQAVAVCLYELARGPRAERELQAGISKVPARDEATSGQLERITAVLLEALQISGYLNSSPRSRSQEPAEPTAAAEEKTRRMVRRLQLPSADADVLVGMLRKMLWKMRHSA